MDDKKNGLYGFDPKNILFRVGEQVTISDGVPSSSILKGDRAEIVAIVYDERDSSYNYLCRGPGSWRGCRPTELSIPGVLVEGDFPVEPGSQDGSWLYLGEAIFEGYMERLRRGRPSGQSKSDPVPISDHSYVGICDSDGMDQFFCQASELKPGTYIIRSEVICRVGQYLPGMGHVIEPIGLTVIGRTLMEILNNITATNHFSKPQFSAAAVKLQWRPSMIDFLLDRGILSRSLADLDLLYLTEHVGVTYVRLVRAAHAEESGF